MDDERVAQPISRRKVLARLGRAGLGLGAGIPLVEWLAACSSPTHAARSVSTPTVIPPTPTATPDTRPISIAITGDIMLARSVNTTMLASHDRFPFNYTADYLSTFDLTVGNLECVVSRKGQPIPGKEFTFEADPLGFARLSGAGFDIVSVANNHSGDFGKDAFMDMLGHLPAYGIQPLGGGANRDAAHRPVIRTIRGTRVGFLAYCEIEPPGFAATATTPGHAWLDPALVQADVAALRPQVDFIVVFTHWGIEYQPIETGHQQAMARLAVDAGADVVVGAHPHVIEPYELYHGKLIVYSLGNFVFDLMPTEDVRRGNVLTLSVQRSRLLDWKLRTSRITGDFGEPRWL
jgi:poly-gamma-glutamate capsule biosynthesis protein CapA/YwtB (metallophosphatase superfamily)